MSHLPMRFHSRNQGYQVLFMEPGTDATRDTRFYSSNTDTTLQLIYSDSSIKNTGPCSLGFDSGTGSGASFVKINIFPQITTYDSPVPGYSNVNGAELHGRLSFYVRFASFPNAALGIFGRIMDMNGPAGPGPGAISIDGSGVLKLLLWDGIFPNFYHQIGSDGPTLSTNTWYRICFCWNNTNRFINKRVVYVNSVLGISVGNINLGFDPEGILTFVSLGWVQDPLVNSAVMNIDDIYLDTADSLEDAGDIRVTNKIPSSNSTNSFPTAIGNNPANRWENVDEQPLSLTNGWSENTGGPYPIDEDYGIQSSASGDVDLSSFGGFYPNVSPATGIRSLVTTSGKGVNLYECGVLISYRNDTNVITNFKPWVCASTVTGSGSGRNDFKIFSNGSAITLNTTDDRNNNGQIMSSDGAAFGSTPRIFFQFFDETVVFTPFRFYSTADGDPFRFHSRD